jgi:CheY-like chemotaxis protein
MLNFTVLVVEDEVLVRMDAAQTLIDCGYKVIEASSAEEAVSILESRDDISVGFTDIQMGGMDGVRLAHAVRLKWPPIKIIVTSGRIDPRAELPSGVGFLSKPYAPELLQEQVQSALDSV